MELIKKRTEIIRNGNDKGSFVAYWTSNTLRVNNNYSLKIASEIALDKNLPLKIFFYHNESHYKCIDRHTIVLLNGLIELADELNHFGHELEFVNCINDLEILNLIECHTIIIDKTYTKRSFDYTLEILRNYNANIVSIDNLYLPANLISNKQEYSAATFRRKYYKVTNSLIDLTFDISRELTRVKKIKSSENTKEKILKRLASLKDEFIETVNLGKNGAYASKENLNIFLYENLTNYEENSSKPEFEYVSKLSKDLHYGFISPAYIIKKLILRKLDFSSSFVEQLLIRRELTFNYTLNNKNYNNINGLPVWALKTLNEHGKDEREYAYRLSDFENGQTHDEYWNAAQNEMLRSGYMHGYMRMYWGKKILEWSNNFKDAHSITLKLNNKYQLDGRSPSGYVGVSWCYGLHDRGWKEREIFGKVRYMNMNGLDRKFDMARYVDRVRNL